MVWIEGVLCNLAALWHIFNSSTNIYIQWFIILSFIQKDGNLEWRCIGHFGGVIPALKQKRRFLLLFHCDAMDCGPTQKSHRSFGRWRNSTQLKLKLKIEIDTQKDMRRQWKLFSIEIEIDTQKSHPSFGKILIFRPFGP